MVVKQQGRAAKLLHLTTAHLWLFLSGHSRRWITSEARAPDQYHPEESSTNLKKNLLFYILHYL
ncbi:Os03g0597450 [Oryza sativa Japonica Group]|uniref:Os03g0597450 protein n=2 Tax=Oryza sativa TaxID=4530 RepID=A0A0P0W054_ORYSJ|nr:hypothetical protein OsI_12497 [Oryza sativa Indica Group]KAB8092557.1 hypothetical protein EE612_018756 [Oryza sativa]BAS85171.1 Os03g0597450 [Oryza sativa Japonica Group]